MKNQETNYIFDFDSTFTQVEALDELANIILCNNPNQKEIQKKIDEITSDAMNGLLPFDKALKERLALLTITKDHIQKLVEVLAQKISTSFLTNKNFFQNNAERIWIVSGGFVEFILPITSSFGIKEENVFANSFLFNSDNLVIDYDKNNPLSKSKGKVLLLKELKLQGEVIVIGDGYTDYEIKEAGLASAFYLFTENVQRKHLYKLADKVIASLDEII